MSNVQLALGLQAGSLIALWLQLLGLPDAQPLVLVSLPLLTAMRLWSSRELKQQRQGWTNGVAVALIVVLLSLMPLADRSSWLASFANLLWLLTGLKLLEMHTPAAIRRNGLLLLIAIGSAAIFASDLGSSLLLATAALLAVGSLLALEMGAASHRQLLRRSSLLLMVSLPLMVGLFLLAPRLSPLSQLQASRGSTGLSDQLDPGSIAALARNNSPVMALQFEGMAAPA
ncbi:MAG: DUF3488 domain-containing protein, partial [Prochlorococcus sp.]